MSLSIHDGTSQCSLGIISAYVNKESSDLGRGKWRRTIVAFRLGGGLRLLLEFLCEGLVVEEGPRVIELAVPCALQVIHGRNHIIYLFVSDERQEGGVDAICVFRIWRIPV